jgi:hypothetical protein
MLWFATDSCAATVDLGWHIGTHGALVIDLLALAMLVTVNGQNQVSSGTIVSTDELAHHTPWRSDSSGRPCA